MATPLENAQTRRAAIMAELAALTVSQPDQSIDGESMSHASNRDTLYRELESLQKLIQQLSGPFVVRQRRRS